MYFLCQCFNSFLLSSLLRSLTESVLHRFKAENGLRVQNWLKLLCMKDRKLKSNICIKDKAI